MHKPSARHVSKILLIGVSQFSHSVMSNSLRPHGLQHARLPCPSSTPRAYSNSNPLSQWCHPTISLSVVPFSSCLQSFPASGSFKWVSPSHQVAKYLSFRFSISPSNEYSGLISFGWTKGNSPIGWISLLSKGLSRVFSNTTVLKHQFFSTPLFFIIQHSHPYMTTGKTIALTRWDFVGKAMSLLFNMLSRLVITFLPRSKHLLISWL